MIIKDMMPAFELYQPTQLKDAFALLDRYGKDAWKMAGGYDSLSWFKDRIKRPKAVIDLTGIAEMKGIRETADGVEIGALTTLTEIERNPVIKAKYRAAGRCRRQGRKPADPQRRHHRRQRLAGCALPLLPLRPALLSGRRQHLLCRHAGRRQPRACAVRHRPLRRGDPVRHRAGAGRARRQVRDQELQGRARRSRPRSSSSARRSTSPG